MAVELQCRLKVEENEFEIFGTEKSSLVCVRYERGEEEECLRSLEENLRAKTREAIVAEDCCEQKA